MNTSEFAFSKACSELRSGLNEVHLTYDDAEYLSRDSSVTPYRLLGAISLLDSYVMRTGLSNVDQIPFPTNAFQPFKTKLQKEIVHSSASETRDTIVNGVGLATIVSCIPSRSQKNDLIQIWAKGSSVLLQPSTFKRPQEAYASLIETLSTEAATIVDNHADRTITHSELDILTQDVAELAAAKRRFLFI